MENDSENKMKTFSYKIDDITSPVKYEAASVFEALHKICKAHGFAFRVEQTIYHSDGVCLTFVGTLLIYRSETDKISRKSSIGIREEQ